MITLDPHVCYRAVKSRDERFDGRFFTGVLTTGIYCRPVCPARTPKPEHVRFFACAAAAEDAGFRPCLRCRPESSPGTPVWQGTSTTVARALRLIDAGLLDEDDVEALAARLGMGARHLRRLFNKHLGASPVAIAQTRRVQFAKKLLDETRLPVTEIAFSAGFSSIRRFNAAFRKTYGQAPSDMRRTPGSKRARPGGGLRLKLYYRPPFDGAALLHFLQARALPGVEQVAGGVYRRAARVGDATGVIAVRLVEGKRYVQLEVSPNLVEGVAQIVARTGRLFDLKADPAIIAQHLASDPLLHDALAARPGLRVPGAWDGFETTVRAVLGQQVSVAAANALAGTLIETYGTSLPDADASDLRYLFPDPAALRQVDAARLGMPRQRAATIEALARAVQKTPGLLSPGARLDDAVAALIDIPGIGPWTAHYIALRALGEPDAFPAADVALRRAATPGQSDRLTATRLRRLAERWRPWRAYAAMHLWHLDAASQQHSRVSS